MRYAIVCLFVLVVFAAPVLAQNEGDLEWIFWQICKTPRQAESYVDCLNNATECAMRLCDDHPHPPQMAWCMMGIEEKKNAACDEYWCPCQEQGDCAAGCMFVVSCCNEGPWGQTNPYDWEVNVTETYAPLDPEIGPAVVVEDVPVYAGVCADRQACYDFLTSNCDNNDMVAVGKTLTTEKCEASCVSLTHPDMGGKLTIDCN